MLFFFIEIQNEMLYYIIIKVTEAGLNCNQYNFFGKETLIMEAKVFKEHLEKNLIPFWNKLKDEENGGFYGYVGIDGKFTNFFQAFFCTVFMLH